MKSIYRIMLGIAFACIGIGIVVGMLGFAINRGHYRNSGKNNSTYSNTATGVESIDVDVQFCKIEIVNGNEFSVEANNIPENGFKSYVEDGVWYLEDQYNKDEMINLFGFDIPIYQGFFSWDMDDDYAPSVTVTIPKDFVAKNVTIKIGAGELNLEELEAANCELKVGAGSISVQQLKTTEEANLDVGAGDIDISNLETFNADFDCGLGSIDVSGEIFGDVTADCGMGEIAMDLVGNEEDYNYYINVGMGNVTLNDDEFSFIASRTIRNDNAIGTFDLKCGMGSIDINIQ
jgi:hypothetical protein